MINNCHIIRKFFFKRLVNVDFPEPVPPVIPMIVHFYVSFHLCVYFPEQFSTPWLPTQGKERVSPQRNRKDIDAKPDDTAGVTGS